MIRFNNDYNHAAHESILEALSQNNSNAYGGYGLDEWCDRASLEIKKHLGGVDCDVHYLVGGTQVNYTFITSALRSY